MIEIKRINGTVLLAVDAAYLRAADLRAADLSGADLSAANMRGANLRGADLSAAYLSAANLSAADMSGADLSGAYLSGADLQKANLCGADLRAANLRAANLSAANMRGAKVPKAPAVENLCALILETILNNGLDMSDWHTCGTAHCLAGWAVKLAGEEGLEIENKLLTNAAGALIWHESIGKIPNFYASNEDAIKFLEENK